MAASRSRRAGPAAPPVQREFTGDEIDIFHRQLELTQQQPDGAAVEAYDELVVGAVERATDQASLSDQLRQTRAELMTLLDELIHDFDNVPLRDATEKAVRAYRALLPQGEDLGAAGVPRLLELHVYFAQTWSPGTALGGSDARQRKKVTVVRPYVDRPSYRVAVQQVLARPRAGPRVVALVGEQGTGRWTIACLALGLDAWAQAAGTRGGDTFASFKQIRVLQMGQLIAGSGKDTYLERLRELLADDVRSIFSAGERPGAARSFPVRDGAPESAVNSRVLFIDDGDLFFAAGKVGGTSIPAKLLLNYARGGKLGVVMTLSPAVYAEYVAASPDLAALVKVVRVEETTKDETKEILTRILGWAERTLADFDVEWLYETIHDNMRGVPMPASAVRVLQQAIAGAASLRYLTREDVESAMATIFGARVGDWTVERRAAAIAKVRERVHGQPVALNGLWQVYTIKDSGLGDTGRPVGRLLFLGPTGVGKTFTAVETATQMGENVVILDFSTYTSSADVARLIGASPGLIGSDKPGELTGPVLANPATYFVLDEFEKADEAVKTALLGVLDSGFTHDASGQVVHFNKATFVFTSNAAALEIAYEFEAYEAEWSTALDEYDAILDAWAATEGGPTTAMPRPPARLQQMIDNQRRQVIRYITTRRITGDGTEVQDFKPEVIARMSRVVVLNYVTRVAARAAIGDAISHLIQRAGYLPEIAPSTLAAYVEATYIADRPQGLRPVINNLSDTLIAELVAKRPGWPVGTTVVFNFDAAHNFWWIARPGDPPPPMPALPPEPVFPAELESESEVGSARSSRGESPKRARLE